MNAEQTRKPVEFSTYVVQEGDTLKEIAEKHDATVFILSGLNGIAYPENIRPGQVLRLPW